MKKIIKTLLVLFVFLITVFPINAKILDDNGSYCNDAADVLSETTEDKINVIANDLELETTAQLVVVTVKTTDGMAIEDYANEVFNTWGIGDATRDNGILILIVTQQKDYWIQTGDGIRKTINDSFLSDLIYDYKFNDMVDYNEKYDERILGVVNKINDKVLDKYQVVGTPTYKDTSSDITYNPMITNIVSIGIWIVSIGLLLWRYKANKKAKMELEGYEIIPEQSAFSKWLSSSHTTTSTSRQNVDTKVIIVHDDHDYHQHSSETRPRGSLFTAPKPRSSTPRTSSSVTRSSSTTRSSSRSSSSRSSSSISRGSGGGRSSGGGVGRH